MTLNACVVCRYVIQLSRIEDVAECGMRDMFAPGTVAPFAADVPLCHLLRVDVEVDGVAAIARGTGRPLHVIRRIEGRPPVRSAIGNVVRAPGLIADVPLSGERIIVVAHFGEVPLFPNAAVHQSNLVLGEFCDFVRSQVGNDSVRVLPRVANHVRHRCFLPAIVDLCMALLAGLRAGKVRRCRRFRFLSYFILGGRAKGSDVTNEVPAFRSGFAMRAGHGWHARQLNPVFDDVVDLPVREILCWFQVQVGHARIEIRTDWRPPVGVNAMAHCAAREKILAASPD